MTVREIHGNGDLPLPIHRIGGPSITVARQAFYSLPGESPLSASGHFGVGVNERALVTGRNTTPRDGKGPKP